MAFSGLHDIRTGALFISAASSKLPFFPFSFSFSSFSSSFPLFLTVPRYDGAGPSRLYLGHNRTKFSLIEQGLTAHGKFTLVQLVFTTGLISRFSPDGLGSFAPITNHIRLGYAVSRPGDGDWLGASSTKSFGRDLWDSGIAHDSFSIYMRSSRISKYKKVLCNGLCVPETNYLNRTELSGI